MCEVGACPDCHVNELAVGPQNALFDFCINDGWTIRLAEQKIRVERRLAEEKGSSPIERMKDNRVNVLFQMKSIQGPMRFTRGAWELRKILYDTARRARLRLFL